MKKINELVITKVKKMSGNVLGIGLTENLLLDTITNNKKIGDCFLLNSTYSEQNITNEAYFKTKKSKKINFNKLKKTFKKNSMDYIIADIEEIKTHMRNFIKDSVFITKNEIIIFGNSEIYDLDKLLKRYKRYTKDILIEEKNSKFVLTINTINAKKKRILEILYRVNDLLVDFIDAISDILCN